MATPHHRTPVTAQTAGGHDDRAHPPIHPVKPFNGDGNPDKARLYEFVVRHFLACCALDAVGQETRVTSGLGGERFTATGLMVTDRNWLEVYPYQRWGSAEMLPLFTEGQAFAPASVDLQPVRGRRPS